MDTLYLYGLDDCHIDYHAQPAPVHQLIVSDLEKLQRRARQAGFQLTVASGYRDFNRQLNIWNAKAEGKRPVLSNDGKVLTVEDLSDWELVQSILRWSALPGTSRHHWGTDIDIYDAGAVAEDYVVQLTDDEVWGEGPFVAMHNWLDQQMMLGEAGGFYRPYQFDHGGTAPERWHLSYAPLADRYQYDWTPSALFNILSAQPLKLKSTVLDKLDTICQRYVVSSTSSQ